MRVVPAPKQPGHTGKWETIRYALDSNARTVRLCFILVIGSSAMAAAVAIVLQHLLLKP